MFDLRPYLALFALALALLACTTHLRAPEPPDICAAPMLTPHPAEGYDYAPLSGPPEGGLWHHPVTGDIYGWSPSEDSPVYPSPDCFNN